MEPLVAARLQMTLSLALVIDGDRRQATLKTKGWF
jgi:hypothetical protein